MNLQGGNDNFFHNNTDRQTDRQVSPEADLDVVVIIDVFSRLLVVSATIESYIHGLIFEFHCDCDNNVYHQRSLLGADP